MRSPGMLGRPEVRSLGVLGVLLRQRLHLAWNGLWRGPGRLRRLGGAAAMATIAVVFVALAGLNAGALIDRLARGAPDAGRQAVAALLVGAVLLSLLTSFGSAFHHLFMAGDLELLLAAPTPPQALFWLKVLETWRSSAHLLLFEAAALFGYGQALRAGPDFYAEALGLGLLLTIGATAVGVLLTLLMARVRFGETLLGLARLLAVLLFIPVGVLGVPAFGARGRVSPFVGPATLRDVGAGLDQLGPPPVWAPTTWAANLLLGEGSPWLWTALLVGLSLLFVLGAHAAFVWLYQLDWERVRYAPPRPPAPRPRFSQLALSPSGPLLGILLKDWQVLVRDPRWRTGAVVSLVALGVPVLAVSMSAPGLRLPGVLRFWLGLFPVPYLAYVFGSQFGAATLAYEGRNIALLRAAPISMGSILLAKLVGGLLLVLPVTLVATLGLALVRGGGPLEVGEALAAASWMSLGGALAGLAAGALTIDFEGDNPQRRVGCLGTIVTSALSLFFFFANAALFAWLLVRGFALLPSAWLRYDPLISWGLAALAISSVLCIAQATRLGLRRLADWEIS